MSLTQVQRRKILQTIRNLVSDKHINVSHPAQDYQTWRDLLDARTPQLIEIGDDADFESGIRDLLGELGSSHTGFFRVGGGIPAPHAINATLRAIEEGTVQRWMFVDVLEEGAAARAGIRPGELLMSVDGHQLEPPSPPAFVLGANYHLEVLGLDRRVRPVSIDVPQRAAKDRPPMIEPRSILHRMLSERLGLLKIATFPGAVGIEFARQLDAAVRELTARGCDRVIIDLRGNIGGGLGSLRLMSYLCPGKLPVGHSLTRSRLRKGYDKDQLVRISKIPSGKLGLLFMAVRFKLLERDRSMVLETEGLGAQPFHHRIVLLVNEFTASAAEMVASFAAENRLATLVGTRTAGQVLGGATFKLVDGYRLRMPIAGWYTWQGQCIEGRGVAPDVEVPLVRESLAQGIDSQLAKAVEIAQAL
jgi:carboxyl-terminal processing protease